MNATQDAISASPAEQAAVVPGLLDFSNHLSEAQANTIYTAAYHLSEKGRYDQASALFGLLGMYRPKESKYAHAVGVCFRKMGRYEEAIRVFARAMELRPDEYEPAFKIIECMMLLGRREQAIDLLETIAGAAGQDGQQQTVDRATALMQLIAGAEQ